MAIFDIHAVMTSKIHEVTAEYNSFLKEAIIANMFNIKMYQDLYVNVQHKLPSIQRNFIDI